MKKWKPLCNRNLKKNIEKKLTEIAEKLFNDTKGISNAGLMGGKPGISLFFSYYSRFSGNDSYSDRSMELISETFDLVNSGFNYHTFAGGLAGIGWTVEHLIKNKFITADTKEIFEDMDIYLKNTMMKNMRQGEYDYLHGALGVALYFLRRRPESKYKKVLETLIDELAKISEKDSHGLKWKSILDHENGTQGYNLSLSHGLASIICILSRIRTRRISTKKVDDLLHGSVNYLLSRAMDNKKYGANFPNSVNESEPSFFSRLGWCYGDLGCAVALWQAWRVSGESTWKEKALDTLKHSTQRRNLSDNRVIDAGLCHGSAGIAHIYNRFYQETGISDFKEAAEYWLDQTLDFSIHIDGIAGYKAWRTKKYGGWVAEPGLLEGAAGIGLAMISAISDIEPSWDECLLLS